jgi:hypothetical protein
MTPHRRLYAESRTEYSWEHLFVKIYSIRECCAFLTPCIVGKDPDWLALNLSFSKDVVLGGKTVSLFPRFLQPCAFFDLLYRDCHLYFTSIAVSLLTNINAQVRRGMRHLVPVIQDRQRHIDEYGQDWDNKPVCSSF